MSLSAVWNNRQRRLFQIADKRTFPLKDCLFFLFAMNWVTHTEVYAKSLQAQKQTQIQSQMHIVSVTKYRKRLLINGIDDFLKKTCSCPAEQNDWNIIAMETDKYHIHILLEYESTERIYDIISSLKRQTTYYLWIHCKDVLSRQYWRKHIF